MFKFNNWIKFLIEPLFSLNGCNNDDGIPTNLANISASNDQTPTITGKGNYGDWVQLFSENTLLGGAWVQVSGDFSITSSVTLPVGQHVLYAIADKDGEALSFSKKSDTITITITP